MVSDPESAEEAKRQNSFGIRVIGISMGLVGMGIALLGFFSGNVGIVASVGGVILLAAIFIYRLGNRTNLKASYKTI